MRIMYDLIEDNGLVLELERRMEEEEIYNWGSYLGLIADMDIPSDQEDPQASLLEEVARLRSTKKEMQDFLEATERARMSAEDHR